VRHRRRGEGAASKVDDLLAAPIWTLASTASFVAGARVE
jgi:hypothetical protein